MERTLEATHIAIGELSVRTAVNIETIRYYEREGLLPKPLRGSNGRRVYAEADVERLQFLRRCRELGFSLADVSNLMSLAANGVATCADVKCVVSKHRADVRGKLMDLQRLDRALAAMEQSCPGSQSTDCPILASLAQT
ncbi:MAG: helix-turn-helix domain-containing protein [Hyphomicrobium aestuarii]|nr:helix-turn-helix domain-containing protein [Hyphomicrobium aestuarii]